MKISAVVAEVTIVLDSRGTKHVDYLGVELGVAKIQGYNPLNKVISTGLEITVLRFTLMILITRAAIATSYPFKDDHTVLERYLSDITIGLDLAKGMN